MDYQLLLLLKFVHVMGAIVWVGGASILTLLCVILDRRGDDQTTLTGVSYVALLGNRVFVPIGLATIITGLILAWLAGYGFAAWTVLATLIVVCTFLLGGIVLGPTCEKAIKLWQENGDASAAIGTARSVLRLVKLDLGGQFAIISLMVLKPGWVDPLLLVPTAILALGALAYHRGAPAQIEAQPA
jgi:uncharacterized membrane protein